MSASIQQFALNETEKTIAASALPEMTPSPTDRAKDAETALGVTMTYHFIDDQKDKFDVMTIEWTPDERLFLTKPAVTTLQRLIKMIGDAPTVFSSLRELGASLSGIYRIV